ncbi:type IV pilus biogenesis/stability protein PilW [Aquabacterium sp.]|uniref:type IV pilus biogenesis/stability protein PilW n=1 Tax=Aquabacterium sp. TaxID=1872578 RepID=UPI003D6C8EB7
MTIFRCTQQACLGLAVVLSLVSLTGCVNAPRSGDASTESTSRAMSRAAAASKSDDVVTASDESDARKRARIRLELATVYFSQNQLTTALDELKHVLAIDGQMSEAHELRGLIYSAMDEPNLADESFKRAIQLDERNGSAIHNYAWWLCGKQRYPEADALFERAANLPQSIATSKTLLARGVCQIRAGLLPDAEKSLARSYELDVANPATAYNLASVLYRRGDYERARFYIRRVNNVPEQITAESIWLGVRIENRLGNSGGRDELAGVLRSRFPTSREATALELGRFDE